MIEPSASRGDAMRRYAVAMSQAHPATADRPCELCHGQRPIVGQYVLRWAGTVRVYWVRILLFSTVFLPAVIIALLLPVAIIPLPNIATGERVAFVTHHPICRDCWRRRRLGQGQAVVTMTLAGLVLAVGLITAAITGAVTASCLFGWFGFKMPEVADFALVFAGSAAACVLAKGVLNRLPSWMLVPQSLHALVQRPFHLSDGKLVRNVL